MGAEAKPKSDSNHDPDMGRSHVIFIVVGLSIVLGGLWLLYSAEGPYHPSGEAQVYLTDS